MTTTTQPEPITVRGIRLVVSQTRVDRLGRRLWDVISDEDGTVWGSGYSREQAIERARRKLV